MKRYRTIVADPPWPYRDGPWGRNSLAPGREFLQYDVMDCEDIAALPIRDLAASHAHLYLWTTQRFVRESYWIAEAWGFSPVCLLAWCKPTMPALPGTFKSTLEFVLFARRGSLAAKQRVDRQWFEWARGAHSAKPEAFRITPEAFLDLVEATSPGPYCELFARRDRLGWDTWGNESLGTAGMVA